jgi:hypothetical protein
MSADLPFLVTHGWLVPPVLLFLVFLAGFALARWLRASLVWRLAIGGMTAAFGFVALYVVGQIAVSRQLAPDRPSAHDGDGLSEAERLPYLDAHEFRNSDPFGIAAAMPGSRGETLERIERSMAGFFRTCVSHAYALPLSAEPHALHNNCKRPVTCAAKWRIGCSWTSEHYAENEPIALNTAEHRSLAVPRSALDLCKSVDQTGDPRAVPAVQLELSCQPR